MLRVTLDTNLIVSSLLVKSGLPAQAIDAWRGREFLLLISPAIIEEITQTLRYDLIRRKYQITEEDVDHLLDLIKKEALVVPGDADVAGSVPDDPDDERVLACAKDGCADLIASGDRHLLALGEYEGISIITVRELLDRLKVLKA